MRGYLLLAFCLVIGLAVISSAQPVKNDQKAVGKSLRDIIKRDADEDDDEDSKSSSSSSSSEEDDEGNNFHLSIRVGIRTKMFCFYLFHLNQASKILKYSYSNNNLKI